MDNLTSDPVALDYDDVTTQADIPQPMRERVPLPGPDDDVWPKMGMDPRQQRYLQGDKRPATSSILTSNSRYLNNPYFREGFATNALGRHAGDIPTTYGIPVMARATNEVTDFERVAELIVAEKKKFPQFGEWLDRRYRPNFTRENTAKYPKGTLGGEINALFDIPGFDMHFAIRQNEGSDIEFLHSARGALHDLEHLVSGFGANSAGETALAILNVTADNRHFTPELARYTSMGQMWVSAGSYTRVALHYSHALPTILEAIHLGTGAGLSIRHPLFLTPWEDYLDWPLPEIARDLGFKYGPGDAWLWTNEACEG
jgi:ubiquinone biosynthesis protein Coq4